MLGWWRRRQAYRERIIGQADELIARHGEQAYDAARDHRRNTLQQHRYAEHRFWCAVARLIADRTGREVGRDTATRYLEGSSSHYGMLPDDDGLSSSQGPLPNRPSRQAHGHLTLVKE